jgi:prepilin-type N-terminal cleavage/methylation domain-containing protein
MTSQRQGFTLLELLTVIAIVSLLSSAAIINVPRQIKKSHDAKRKTDVHELQVALELYFTDNQLYPVTLPAKGLSLTSPDGQIVYLNKMPADPVARDPYLYTYWATPAATPSTYIICSYRLETQTGSFCLTNRQ